MLDRDAGRLADAAGRADRSPAGSGAVAGTGLPIDRDRVAAELGFGGLTDNSIDAVSDRDYAIETVAALAILLGHLSRLGGELVLWSTPYLGFARLDDAFSSGSSMLPNKRNPDPAELVRGKTARVIGALTAVLVILKGLPLAYQRDLQEDKPPLFGAIAAWEGSLGVMAGLITTLAVDRERMRAAAGEGYTTATAIADALVRRGVPFRVAHHVVGSLVAQAEGEGIGLEAMPDAMIGGALAAVDDETARGLAAENGIGDQIRQAASIKGALETCDVIGGTAPRRVAEALAAARARLG